MCSWRAVWRLSGPVRYPSSSPDHFASMVTHVCRPVHASLLSPGSPTSFPCPWRVPGQLLESLRSRLRQRWGPGRRSQRGVGVKVRTQSKGTLCLHRDSTASCRLVSRERRPGVRPTSAHDYNTILLSCPGVCGDREELLLSFVLQGTDSSHVLLGPMLILPTSSFRGEGRNPLSLSPLLASPAGVCMLPVP